MLSCLSDLGVSLVGVKADLMRDHRVFFFLGCSSGAACAHGRLLSLVQPLLAHMLVTCEACRGVQGAALATDVPMSSLLQHLPSAPCVLQAGRMQLHNRSRHLDDKPCQAHHNARGWSEALHSTSRAPSLPWPLANCHGG